MRKPFGPRFGKMYAKFRTFRNCVYHLHKSGQFAEKRPRRPETGIKRWLWRNGTRIPVWEIPSGKKTGLPFQIFSCSRKFSAGTTQDVLFHLLSNRIFWKLFENGKQPITAIIKNMESYFLSPKVSSNLPTQSLIDWLPFCKVLVPAGHALQLVICSVSW